MLGVRPLDIRVDEDGRVHPGTGGLSVARDNPAGLPDFRRPPEWGGTGRDPVWRIEARALGGQLRYRDDPLPDQALHGMIEPGGTMSAQEFAGALEATREDWQITRPTRPE
jgi:hypothetical protein